ncbi:MAG: ATP-dependent RecD-like DNA helicase [Thermaurantimonas sp.]
MIKKEKIFQELKYDPTDDQIKATEKILEFLTEDSAQIFILKGSAGTGKTTLVTSLVKCLPSRSKFVLLAPTGRAAKVMSQYAHLQASTIHRHIYYTTAKAGKFSFRLKVNQNNDTLYLIDEASMLGLQQEDTDASLMEDVLEFIFSGHRNKLILVGDHAQLPPVRQTESPALNADIFRSYFFMNVSEAQLSSVVRQQLQSNIVFNATRLRDSMASEPAEIPLFKRGADFTDLKDRAEIFEKLCYSFDSSRVDQSIILVRSNKRANMYNSQIRQRILQMDSELDAGDRLMVVKNNYFWLDSTSPAGFIANGDILEVRRVYKVEEKFGFRFAKVRVRMTDMETQPDFDTIVLLDTLYTESASLGYEEYVRLITQISVEEYSVDTKRYFKKILSENEYANSLQVKFSYAITVHKAQGGQWNTVYVEKPYLPDDSQPDTEYIRWLYTAFTRGKSCVFLLGFSDNYFE